MTDGDMNEIVQLEEAINDFMPGCFQQQCGWYIIFKGWKKNCNIGSAVQKAYKKIFHLLDCIMMHWCSTFMYLGYCESVDELRISQALLLKYIHSPSVCKFRFQELH